MPGRGRRRRWHAELKRAIGEAAEHLSLYQLTIEPDTPFATLHKAGKLITPDDDTARELFDLTQEICEPPGFPPTKSPITPGPGPSAGTISCTGAGRNMPASGRAHTAGSISMAAATPPRPRSGPRPG